MSISLSVKKIDESCPCGKSAAGSFVLHSKNTGDLILKLRTSHRRIRLSLYDHTGPIPEEGLEISYEISTTGFDPGTVFKSMISVISNEGEERIPVTLSLVRNELVTSAGPVRNLFHFTNLAKDNFDEAVEIFYTDDLSTVFASSDRETYMTYRAFKGMGEGARGVEEFLIETNKKNPVILSFAEGNVMERSVREDREIPLTVRRSGWGYPGFRLSSQDDFIEIVKDSYEASDFEGNFAAVSIIIKADRLHAGHNFGRLDLTSLHSNVSLPVFVDMPFFDKAGADAIRTKHAVTARLMRDFISFRIGDLSSAEWIERSDRQLERLLTLDRNDPESRLMQVQLLLASKRYDEAEIVLSAVEREMVNRDYELELKAYYIYLRAMCDQDPRLLKQSVKEVWELFERSGRSWRILWILIYLDESIKMSPEREKDLIAEQIEAGARSPLIYLEAYSVISNDPSLIRTLSDFEINVLGFAIKNGLLKKELSDAAALLTSRMRGFDPRLIRILGAYYKEFKTDDILTAICSYLIRNEISDRKYFRYFADAVERDLGVTNLYDFYLYTMDHASARLLPKNVLMYYGFRNDLPPNLKAYVYANMIVNRDEAGTFLTQSMDECVGFAASELMAGHMDENIAIIIDFARFFRGSNRPDIPAEKIDRAIVENGFMRLVTVKDPSITSLIVIEEAFKGERKVPVRNGRAYVNIYDNDHRLFFEDDEGRRFGNRFVPYDEIRLLKTNDYLNSIEYPDVDDPGLWVALCEKGKNDITIDDRNVALVRRIEQSDLISESFREGLFSGLLRYYYDKDLQKELGEMLEDAEVDRLSMDERNEYIRFCSIRGDDDEAFDVIRRFGSYGMDPKILMRISTRFLEEGRPADDVMNEIAYASFRGGKYNEVILDHLARNHEGTSRELRDIWKACRGFDAETGVIEGRIIDQTLFTGTYIGERDEIFFDYLKKDASKRVVSEYFRKVAGDHFSNDSLTDDRFFMALLDYAIDEDITDAEALSLIRFFADRRDMRSDRILLPYIRDLAERDMVFAFFLKYTDLLPALKLFREYVMIEHRGEHGSVVEINYCMENTEADDVDFKKERMTEVFAGVYQWRGLVFPGETLQYYISENGKGGARLTKSGIERSSEQLSMGENRYEILQDALAIMTLKDNDSFLELAGDYMRKERIVEEIIWEGSSDTI